jgi:hypothetical protein
LFSEYGLVQDLGEINEAIVPNSYNILAQIPAETSWFTVVDLKDAFFCVPLDLKSQFLFVFKWIEPDTLEATQCI